MKRLCAWCLTELEPNPDGPADETSHGICPNCKFHMKASAGMEINQYIEDFPRAIVLMDPDGSVNSANKKAREIFNPDLGKIEGLPRGEVFECEHSHLPEGCGNTKHCSSCQLKNIVDDTFTGKSHVAQDISLKQENDKTLTMSITTEKVEKVVFLQVNEIKSSK